MHPLKMHPHMTFLSFVGFGVGGLEDPVGRQWVSASGTLEMQPGCSCRDEGVPCWMGSWRGMETLPRPFVPGGSWESLGWTSKYHPIELKFSICTLGPGLAQTRQGQWSVVLARGFWCLCDVHRHLESRTVQSHSHHSSGRETEARRVRSRLPKLQSYKEGKDLLILLDLYHIGQE